MKALRINKERSRHVRDRATRNLGRFSSEGFSTTSKTTPGLCLLTLPPERSRASAASPFRHSCVAKRRSRKGGRGIGGGWLLRIDVVGEPTTVLACANQRDGSHHSTIRLTAVPSCASREAAETVLCRFEVMYRNGVKGLACVLLRSDARSKGTVGAVV